ncbi:4-hydroxy-tetrahydrodipicolinate synthase [Mesorhizobium sp. LHD-90]|uniref:4-hydroxy-tetrahydrodipicolinate synthase n=1 Tax=Mesorhizobium sp. LHD-90 TaxID=3071414 RepID=UPI0027E1575A|nr:4-hydroxy-tetrahydrodipicolinate synthase [Mesorhizobium sp. LHD-90]MDQ6433610.1 4-hydroxy-tetrahydrodipicolinate synthase [Mesorhizobium sp. LHD-90]
MNPDDLRSRLGGAMTALVTPFRDGSVDRPALRALVEWQVEEGIAALVPCGTTGEAPTLSFDERVAVMRVCVDAVAGRIPVLAGTGTNDTRSTIALTSAARAFGADAALIVTPYYSRPTQEGIFRHFQAVARQVDLPIVVYNVPSRTGVDLTPATLERLASIPAIVGIKDATGDLTRPMAVSHQLGERFVQLSGHDATAFGFNTMGGRGTISVVSNVAPRLCVDMHDACARGDVHAARAIHKKLRPLVAALELESNPVPVKHALHLLGWIRPEVRLPLVPVLPETAASIDEALRALAAFSPLRVHAA